MKIDAVGVSSSNLKKTVEFYSLLGFQFPEFKPDEEHLEPVTPKGSARLMIDSVSMLKGILGKDPKPGNHSSFAILYDTPAEVNAAAEKVKGAGFKIVTEPWDAFWGQRYAIVEDPDGYKVDLFAAS
ncbi:MAG: VOC family protein [Anaerolineales bacterium]